MKFAFNTRLFADMLRTARGSRGLRDDVSASTLSRLENEMIPDLDTFLKLCEYLNMPPDHFIIRSGKPRTPDDVVTMLMIDESLSFDVRAALVVLIGV